MKRYTLLLSTFLTTNLLSATFNVSNTSELREALNNAASNYQDDIIILANGTYKTTDDNKGTFSYLSAEANTLTLKGSSAANVILSGDNKERIFSHQSTEKTKLIIEKLTFRDAYNSNRSFPAGHGGAIYTEDDIDLIDSQFLNNYSYGYGAAVGRAGKTTIKNSIFKNNTSSYATLSLGNSVVSDSFFEANKNALRTSSLEIKNTKFLNNSSGKGGGFYATNAIVENCFFEGNKASSVGGGFYAWSGSDVIVKNSIFINNTAPKGGAIYQEGSWTTTFNLTNSLFIDNSSGINVDGTENAKIYNSTFIRNNNTDINGDSSVIVKVTNNYIDESNIKVPAITNSNIFDGINLGFTSESAKNFTLTKNSGLIDKGTLNTVGVTLPQKDYAQNARTTGSTVDIGPYELVSSKPIINSFYLTGTKKENNKLTFYTNYTLGSQKYIKSVEYDYLNNNTWTKTNTYTYLKEGTYTIKVKVTDNQGEFSISSMTITIAPTSFYELNDEQKLIKAIDPKYYNEVMQIIEKLKNESKGNSYNEGIVAGKKLILENLSIYDLISLEEHNKKNNETYNSAFNLGEKEVLNNPSKYGFIKSNELNSSVEDAINKGKESGIKIVLDNPDSYNLISKNIMNEKIKDVNSTAITLGENKVLNNPTMYGLIKSNELNSSVVDAINKGKESGIKIVLDNPDSYNLISKNIMDEKIKDINSSAIQIGKNTILNNPTDYKLQKEENILISKEYLNSVSSGWTIIGSAMDINDMNIFDNIDIVWFYDNKDKKWKAYSSNIATKNALQNQNYELLEKIPAKNGFWINK